MEIYGNIKAVRFEIKNHILSIYGFFYWAIYSKNSRKKCKTKICCIFFLHTIWMILRKKYCWKKNWNNNKFSLWRQRKFFCDGTRSPRQQLRCFNCWLASLVVKFLTNDLVALVRCSLVAVFQIRFSLLTNSLNRI